MKSYIDYMNEISPDDLFDGLLGHGLFAEKLPPVFTSVKFCDYVKMNTTVIQNVKRKKFVYFESMRNTNIPRSFGIPEPFAYAHLCLVLKNNWNTIKMIFQTNTMNDEYKVSRIHIRKIENNSGLLIMDYGQATDLAENSVSYDSIPESPDNNDCSDGNDNNGAIFSMNYKSWKDDGDPLIEFSLGKRYVIKTDISQCFPSAYSHSIPWALEGKSNCKHSIRNHIPFWSDEIDKACRKIKDDETNGLIIGPHASNVLSEILLSAIDKELRKRGYKYIRHIDDYTCYTETYKEAEDFLTDLNTELREYCLTLNYKKTSIAELPQASAEEWVQILKDKYAIERDRRIQYDIARAYLDTAILAMKKNGNNSSSLFFAIKVLGNLSNDMALSAKNYCVRRMCDLAIIYPYLLPNMEKYVFNAFQAASENIESFTQKLYDDSADRKNYEGISYSLYYATIYDFSINVDEDMIINSSDCISKVLLWIYANKHNETSIKNKLYNKALSLSLDSFDEYWIFIYEVLADVDLTNEWKDLKQAGVSFLII